MKNFALIFAALLLWGCATIMTGTSQGLRIDTPHVTGASCELTDKKGTKYYLQKTPGSVTVRKGDGPMTIVCKKEGYHATTIILKEGFHGATLGNILLGGPVGIIIDAVSGAAQKYPKTALVWLEPLNWESEEEREAWLKEKQAFEKAENKKKKDQQFDDEQSDD